MTDRLPSRYALAERTIINEQQIWAGTRLCAKRIAADYKKFNLSIDNPLILICVLKGSFMFAADLSRFLADEGVPVKMEFICVSSYGDETTTTGKVRLLLDLRQSIEGKHALVVEDIVDSAVTLRYLMDLLNERKPASLKTVVLLDKPAGRKVPFETDYRVTTIPHAFVVGYGLDFAESYRELRDVVELKRCYYERSSKL